MSLEHRSFVSGLGRPFSLRRVHVLKMVTRAYTADPYPKSHPGLIAQESNSGTQNALSDKFTIRGETRSLAHALNVESSPPFAHESYNRPKVVGHRGSVFSELENTVRGFQHSAKIGCDAIELDVFLLKCGTLVVFHGSGTDESPGWLQDYCGREGNILDFNATEARLLRFDPSNEDFVCPKEKLSTSYIPTLAEVLTIAKATGIEVMIELKGPGTETAVLDMVEQLDMVDQCHFSSFAHERVARIRKIRPEQKADGTYRYRTGCLFNEPPDNFIEIARSVGANEVHLRYDTCTKERIQAIHDAGMDSMAWFRGPKSMREDVLQKYHDVGNEDEAMYLTVVKTGVRSMCINKPDILIGLVKK